MLRINFTLIVGLLSTLLFSQLTVGLESNSQWYVDDDKVELSLEEAEERLRSQNYLKVDYKYKKFEAGVQIESYEPISLLNYNPDFKGTGIGTVHIDYNDVDNGIQLTAGHFYEQFGSGLAFRSFENRPIGINNALFGGRAKINMLKGTEITLIGGKQRTAMGFDFSDGVVYGSDINLDLSEFLNFEKTYLSIGGSYVVRDESTEGLRDDIDDNTSMIAGRIDFSSGKFYASAEYVHKSEDSYVELGNVLNTQPYDGNAVLLNFGYSQKGLGVDVNLRRLENMGFFSQRDLEGNQFLAGSLNYIPSLTKQYDYALENIYVYQPQPYLNFNPLFKSGEIGGQIDVFYKFNKGTLLGGKYGTQIAVNGSLWHGLKELETNVGDRTYERSDFLDFGEKYYSDIGVEIRKKWSPSWSSIFTYMNQYYNARYVEDTRGQFVSNVGVMENTFKIGGKKSIRTDVQHLWSNDGFKDWVGGTVEFNLNANYSVYVNDIYNYGNDDEDEQIHYYNVGAAYNKGATRISVNYGRQRGGLLCVGGVCRIVSEAAGLTLNITTNF